ncbi:MAG: gamma carbonic anhydrase family protein [Proteobacteria bacterium]|nr:gamma carbonic anhydrase family protein [Pseudomonadota bacterium]
MAIYEFEGKKPRLEEGVYIHPSASVIGDVIIGKNCFVGPGAVLRGDFGGIRIGDGTCVQDNAVVHADPEFTASFGRGCHIAHGAVVHHSEIGDNVLIGIGAIILPQCRIGDDVLIAAGTLLTPNTRIPSGKMVMGRPGKVTRDLQPEMIDFIKLGNLAYQELSGRYRSGLKLISL